MRSITYERIAETAYEEVLQNGLKIHLIPKPGFSKTYAVFTTRYGSVDNHFQVEGCPEHHVPDGIAHFLEHKLFEEEWGDVSHTFATQGASANAYTTHHYTAYLFSATDRVEENLETLIDFVQRPHFTDENVEKEKGIIGQEIAMYDEMPFWRGYRHMLECLFQVAPVRLDIAGTVESIAAIDREALKTCYEAFYHPSNMMLCLVGDFEPKRLVSLIAENQARKTFSAPRPIHRFFEVEPSSIHAARSEVRLSVTRPLVLMGWKDARVGGGESRIRQELVMALVQDLVFGRTSVLAQELLDRGIVDDALSADYEAGPGYGFSYVASETDDPALLEREILAGLAKARRDGLDPEDFERARRKQIGAYLRCLDSPEAIANHLTGILLKGGDFFRLPDILSGITCEEASAALREHFNPDQLVVSVVLPAEIPPP